jgi:outer membrane cobalamin receptor
MSINEELKAKHRENRLACQLAAAIIFGGLFAGGTGIVAAADNTVADEYTLEDTVVTAERIPTKKMETPANVTVITAKEIEDNHYADMSEALQHVNGAIVTSQGGNGSDALLRLNGDDRVVIMIDGQRLNQEQGIGVGRAGVNLNMLPSMKNIERIEIVKGGSSALYGSDAVGGVVNIITKKVKENKTTLDLNTGSWGTHNYEITNEGSERNVSWFVTGALQKRSYFKYKLAGSTDTMPASDYNNNALSVRLDAKLDDASSLRLGIEHKSINSDAYYNCAASGYFQNELFNNWSMTYNFKENTNVPGYFRYFNNYKAEDYDGAFNTRLQGFDYQNGWDFNKKNRLVAGVEWHQSDSTNVTAGYTDKIITNKAFYLQDTMKLNPKWSFVPGIRMDHHSMFGTHWTPKVAVNYNANDNTQVYASWGRVYKAPTADDLYYRNDIYQYYGNPNLKPESGYTETLGINHKLDAKTNIQASVFQSEIHDAIRWGDNYPCYVENLNREKKRGFEISFQKKADSVWSYDAGYSYIKCEMDENKGAGMVLEPKNTQPNGYRFGLHYNKGAWKSNLSGTIGSGLNTTYFTTRSYAVFDFNISCAINKQTTAYFKVNNLTNQEYSAYGNSVSAYGTIHYPAPGRFFQVGVTYSF